MLSSNVIICRYRVSLCSVIFVGEVFFSFAFQCDLIGLCQWLIVMVIVIMSICTQCKPATQEVEFVVEKKLSIMAIFLMGI